MVIWAGVTSAAVITSTLRSALSIMALIANSLVNSVVGDPP